MRVLDAMRIVETHHTTRTLIHSLARGNSQLSEIASLACVSSIVDYNPFIISSREQSTSAFAQCAHSYKGSNLGDVVLATAKPMIARG
jgi:hypothetical protein